LRKLIYILILFTISFQSISQVEIKSVNKSYCGKELVIYTFKDFITELKKSLDTCVVDSTGIINFSFEIKKTQQVFIDIGVFRCNIFVEPHKNYEIILPDFQERNIEDKLNPFFEFTTIYVGIKNEESKLNKYIRAFDELFESYVNDFRLHLLLNSYHSNVDTFIMNLDSLFLDANHSFFKDYKYYRYAQLRNLAYERNTKFATKEYLLFKPFLYNNVAYTEFFNQLYNNYFDHYARSKEGQRIFYDIAYSKSTTAALKTLDKNISLVNDTLRELVLIKGIHDAFLNPDWPTNPLLQTLDSVILLTRINEHRDIAKNIKTKVTKLRKGFNAPDFELYSKDSILKSLADFNGKFIYLNFCTSWSFECQKQFESLKKLQESYPKHLNVVSISADQDFSTIINDFEEKKYKWELLHYANNEDVIEEYQVKVFPMYYLIDPTGKLIMNPAPTPAENFEQYLINILRSRLRRTN
jgi:peroxiredoxin